MATKKKVAAGEPELLGAIGNGYSGPLGSVPFDERKYFIQDLAKEILLSISARRSNGQPIRGDEKAAVESAIELANLLGVK